MIYMFFFNFRNEDEGNVQPYASIYDNVYFLYLERNSVDNVNIQHNTCLLCLKTKQTCTSTCLTLSVI